MMFPCKSTVSLSPSLIEGRDSISGSEKSMTVEYK